MTKRRAELARDELDKMIGRTVREIEQKKDRLSTLRVAREALAEKCR